MWLANGQCAHRRCDPGGWSDLPPCSWYNQGRYIRTWLGDIIGISSGNWSQTAAGIYIWEVKWQIYHLSWPMLYLIFSGREDNRRDSISSHIVWITVPHQPDQQVADWIANKFCQPRHVFDLPSNFHVRKASVYMGIRKGRRLRFMFF